MVNRDLGEKLLPTTCYGIAKPSVSLEPPSHTGYQPVVFSLKALPTVTLALSWIKSATDSGYPMFATMHTATNLMIMYTFTLLLRTPSDRRGPAITSCRHKLVSVVIQSLLLSPYRAKTDRGAVPSILLPSLPFYLEP